MRKTVSAMNFLPAEDACGRRGWFNAPRRAGSIKQKES
jgi:hypothetical protein